MKGLEFLNPPAFYLEIGQTSLTLLKGEEWIELPLERLPNARLTPTCKQQLTLRLQAPRLLRFERPGRVSAATGAAADKQGERSAPASAAD